MSLNAITAEEWFMDESKRSGPHIPLDLLDAACFRGDLWGRSIVAEPWDIACDLIKYREVARVSQYLFGMIKGAHEQFQSEVAPRLFDEYLSATCPKCLHGINGNTVQMLGVASMFHAVVGGDAPFTRLRNGQCPNCDSYSAVLVWHGDKQLGRAGRSDMNSGSQLLFKHLAHETVAEEMKSEDEVLSYMNRSSSRLLDEAESSLRTLSQRGANKPSDPIKKWWQFWQ